MGEGEIIQPRETQKLVIEQAAVSDFFREVRGKQVSVIASETFLYRSKDRYNPSWLVREIVQNFVDKNTHHPGTLDGVNFVIEDLPDGKKRFIIEGKWPFTDHTGLHALHSDKSDTQKTAGGNAIGIKQAAMRFLRDFGVSYFGIEGEGWNLNYDLAKANIINAEIDAIIQSDPSKQTLRKLSHNWLIAEINPSENSGSCKYVIETDNPEVIVALSKIPELGVSENNPYLQSPDFKNQQGSIKWLSKEQIAAQEKGRLFINGQVMNYLEEGKTAADYWRGPEGVTIELKNINYDMSIDRPPIDSFNLEMYLRPFITSMETEELFSQIRASEHLWTDEELLKSQRRGVFAQPGFAVLIESIADFLKYKRDFSAQSFRDYCKEKKYVAANDALSESQKEEIRNQGYTICLQHLSKIGMPSAKDLISPINQAKRNQPDVLLSRIRTEGVAQSAGLAVAYDEISSKAFEELIQNKGTQIFTELVQKEAGKVVIVLESAIPEKLLSQGVLSREQEKQKLLLTIRSIIYHGLRNNIFSEALLAQGDNICTFAINTDPSDPSLYIRITPGKTEGPPFLEIKLADENHHLFQTSQNANQQQIEPHGTQEIRDQLPSQDKKPIERKRPPWYKKVLATAALLATVGATPLGERVISSSQNTSGEKPPPPITEQSGQSGSFFTPLPELIFGNINAPKPQNEKQQQLKEQQLEEARMKLQKISDSKLQEAQQTEQELGKFRGSEAFAKQEKNKARYMTGKTLDDILNAQNTARINESKKTQSINQELQQIINDITEEHGVEDFEIVLEPTDKQLSQLGLLRTYVFLTTGARIPNDVFIYKGTGSKGLNIGGKAIGLHEELLRVEFSEAISTFIHEIAHNVNERGHGNKFRNTMQSLFVTAIDTLSKINKKIIEGKPLTDEEANIIEIQDIWAELK